MTCKECIHFDVCEADRASHIIPMMQPTECPLFERDKSKFVEQKTAKLLKTTEPLGWEDVECAECSNCHESWTVSEDYSFEEQFDGFNYCPNCGAKFD